MSIYRKLFPHRHPMSKLDAEAWVLLGVIVVSAVVVIVLL